MDEVSSDPSGSSASDAANEAGSASTQEPSIEAPAAKNPTRNRRRVYLIGVCALVVIVAAAATGIVVIDRGTSSRDLTLVVADTTKENRVPANARIVLDSSAEWFPTWQGGRASQVYKGEVKPGEALLVTAAVPSELRLRLQLPKKLPKGTLTALLTISDSNATLVFGNATATIKRDDPVADARHAAQAAFVAEMKRVENATKQVDNLSDQANAAYDAIFGPTNKAPAAAVVKGIDANVAPKVSLGEEILASVTSKDPRIADWLNARTTCWSLWAVKLQDERNHSDTGQPSEDAVTAAASTYNAACNVSSAKRKALETAAGIR